MRFKYRKNIVLPSGDIRINNVLRKKGKKLIQMQHNRYRRETDIEHFYVTDIHYGKNILTANYNERGKIIVEYTVHGRVVK